VMRALTFRSISRIARSGKIDVLRVELKHEAMMDCDPTGERLAQWLG
jgi:hypothetical protein